MIEDVGEKIGGAPKRLRDKKKSKPKKASSNKLVTNERYAELLEKLRKKLAGQLNNGIDPENPYLRS